MSNLSIVEVELALQYARRKKINRLNQNNIHRRKARLKCYSNFSCFNSFAIEQSAIEKMSLMNSSLSNEESSIQSHFSSHPTIATNPEDKTSENDELISLTNAGSDFHDVVHVQNISKLNIHPYTSEKCLSFSKNLLGFIRRANISKIHAENLVSLIQSGLPQPNTFPKTYPGILNLLSAESLFIKRIVCILCKSGLSIMSKTCPLCAGDDARRLAIIFDSIQETIFTCTYNGLSSIINSYRENFEQDEMDIETNDIVYNKNYRILRDSTHYPFISIIVDLHGIGLDKTNKEHLWIFSCSICELPPAVRNRRQNNIILSLWISKEQPDINLWLDRCFTQLINFKKKGKNWIKES